MKKIVIIDLNGTMVNKGYEPTIPLEKLLKSLVEAKDNGLVVGLSSDSPTETLRMVALSLGIDGPIVAEGGAVLCIDETVVLNPDAKVFQRCSNTLVEHLINNRNPSRIVSVGDINRLTRLLVSHEDIIGTNATEAIFINGLRIASSSFFCLERVGMVWSPSARLLEYLSNWSIQYLDENKLINRADITIDSSIDYGVCILHHKNTKKSLALQPLRILYPNASIFIIGDSIFDWHGEVEGVVHCAVSNASSDYKEHCSYVASKPMTEGVLELIDTISSI